MFAPLPTKDIQPPDWFFVVWREDGGPPTKRYDDKSDAVGEAERLARTSPGARFFVLLAVAAVAQPLPPVITTPLRDPEIPF